MAETHGFIRIMPDSSGKRVPHSVFIELTYDNGTILINNGDIIVGSVSGMTATVLEVTGTVSAGEIHALFLDNVPTSPAFVIGENIQVNGITHAKAANVGYPYYTQQTNITSIEDPTHGLKIDVEGAAYTRYAEGSPQFDSFGKLLVAQQTTVAEYLATYGVDTEKLSVELAGAGSVTHLPLHSGMLMTNGTAAGDRCELVSHFYHPYNLGMGRLIEFTNMCGDAGKNNLTRKWGYGDDNDGLFFMEINGVLNAVIVNSSSGSVVYNYYPQTEWSHDRLDGTNNVFNPSGKTFIRTFDNITWIDFQWLGAGKVRFGVVLDGERILCHEVSHSNSLATPYMRSGSLPIYFEQANTGVTASSSEFRIWCTVVKNGGIFKPSSKDFTFEPAAVSVTSTTPVVIANMRASQQINSINNRKSSYIEDISVFSSASPVVIELWKNCTIGGTPSWSSPESLGALDFDTAGTVTGGRKLKSWIVGTGNPVDKDLSDLFNYLDEGIRRKFNITLYDTYTLTAKLASGSTTTSVITSINWDDVG